MIPISVVCGALLISVVSAQPAVGGIAFTVGINEDVQLEAGGLLKFTNIITNYGGEFSKGANTFRPRKNGVYGFNLNAVSYRDDRFELAIYVNDKYVVSTKAHADGDYAFGGNTVAVKLVVGDEVNVRALTPSYLYGGQGKDILTTFNGYLIGFTS